MRFLFCQKVRLVVGQATKKVLRAAGAHRARMVVIRAGKGFPQQMPSDADAETVGQLVEVRRCGNHTAFTDMQYFYALLHVAQQSDTAGE